MSSTTPRRRTLRRIAVPLTAAAIATGVAAALATPAAASNTYNGRAYIYGAGSPKDDLNDEGVVSMTRNSNSTVTCLWQEILFYDGYLPKSGIDGKFGPKTKAATIAWQKRRGLVGDGSAGKLTWKKAGAHFNWHIWNGEWAGSYETSKGFFMVYRNYDKGNWEVATPHHGLPKAGYNTLLC